MKTFETPVVDVKKFDLEDVILNGSSPVVTEEETTEEPFVWPCG